MSSNTRIAKILFLGANPKNRTKLLLDKEVCETAENLRTLVETHPEIKGVILLLVRSSCTDLGNWDFAIKEILERYEVKRCRIISVVIDTVGYNLPINNSLALSTNTKILTKWQESKQAFLSVIQGIREQVREITVSSYPAQKSLRRIKAVLIPAVEVGVLYFKAFFTKISSNQRLLNAALLLVAKPLFLIGGAILLSPLVPDIVASFSEKPNLTLNPAPSITPIGWIRIGVVNNTISSFSVVEQLLQSSDPHLAPSIDSPVVPSIGAVVSVKNPVNLRKTIPQEYDADLPQKVGLLKPQQKLVILRVRRLLNVSSRIEVWAQVGKCEKSCRN